MPKVKLAFKVYLNNVSKSGKTLVNTIKYT